MIEQKTFRNLQLLEEGRTMAKLLCKENYAETVKPYITTIEKVAEANNENHFEAMKRINTTTDFTVLEEKKILFSAALMEIVEEKNLKF
ncbi:hypothetical protein [Chryseobacterium sp. MP_3.2]|uniref:hypothetical protein n=1 Tax=Chryseobacterium sp. MP_3.2 TaxID=3071712 RepID=UPI002DFEDE6C|nr:hypothetical protein [Chryseobacterium sp. MP_3.2]